MMRYQNAWILISIIALLGCVSCVCSDVETKDASTLRKESFDNDPGWDGKNNRIARELKPETIRQNFGYSPKTKHAGGKTGEIGGTVYPGSEPAFYAKPIPLMTLNDHLSASGKMLVVEGGSNILFGFFNSKTINEWRTPNAMTFRINGRGEIYHAHMEFITSKWRATAGIIGSYNAVTDRNTAIELPVGVVHKWSFEYDPAGNKSNGSIAFTVAGIKSLINFTPDLKKDGTAFDRFGLLNVIKSFDGAGDIWLDDILINGKVQNFDHDPKWKGLRNRATYITQGIRPRFDFGYSPTRYAGGKAAGELGGTFYRGDCRYPDKMGCYGDRLGTLTLECPLHASGKVTMRRGVSDSTTSIGFYNSKYSMAVTDSQQFATPRDFLGVCIEGPSGDGFYFYPSYRGHETDPSSGYPDNAPNIMPDGAVHDWMLDYDPAASQGNGQITVTLDGKPTRLELAPGVMASGAIFDRFGIVTSWIDGNAQVVYFDDLEYTCR